MFKELTLQNIWESDIPVENGSTFKIKSTLWWPVLVEGLSEIKVDRYLVTLPARVNLKPFCKNHLQRKKRHNQIFSNLI
jgi:hypothetical protein